MTEEVLAGDSAVRRNPGRIADLTPDTGGDLIALLYSEENEDMRIMTEQAYLKTSRFPPLALCQEAGRRTRV